MNTVRLSIIVACGLISGTMLQATAQQPPAADKTAQTESEQAAQVDAQPQADAKDAESAIAEPEPLDRWEYIAPLVEPAAATAETPANPLADLVLTPSIFTHSRLDLADVRLFNSKNEPIPYALRYLRPASVRTSVEAVEFNRAEPDDGPSELTLDLMQDDIHHNEIDIVTTGANFRRLARVDGSDDGKTWRELATGHLLRYEFGVEKFEHHRLSYSPSRFRYVRIQVSRDPEIPQPDQPQDEFKITSASVLHTIEVPGARLMLDAELGEREPVRTYGAPGSAWIIDLGGKRIPCERLEVEIADREFARDIEIEYELFDEESGQSEFTPVSLSTQSLWQRKVTDDLEPMVAEFSEVQTSRLRLRIFDHRNPPLRVQRVRFGAAIRQIVFPRVTADQLPLSLYFGNPEAEPPGYDFARNLPEELVPPPARWTISEVAKNPAFVPTPKQVTERLPWLIYAVLGTVAAALGIVIFGISRTAIAVHDAQAAASQ